MIPGTAAWKCHFIIGQRSVNDGISTLSIPRVSAWVLHPGGAGSAGTVKAKPAVAKFPTATTAANPGAGGPTACARPLAE